MIQLLYVVISFRFHFLKPTDKRFWHFHVSSIYNFDRQTHHIYAHKNEKIACGLRICVYDVFFFLMYHSSRCLNFKCCEGNWHIMKSSTIKRPMLTLTYAELTRSRANVRSFQKASVSHRSSWLLLPFASSLVTSYRLLFDSKSIWL